MLRKMLVHGLIAAAVIGCAAAVYADGRNDGPATDIASPAMRAETGPRTDRDNGYIADSAGHTERNRHLRQAREHEREHEHSGRGSRHRRDDGERDGD